MSGIIAAAGISAAAGLAGGLMKSGGSGGTQTQTQQSSLPGWVENNAMWNYGQATDVANNLMQPYSGQRVASMTPQMQNLIQQLYGNVGSTNAAYDQASGYTNALAGYNPTMVNPQTLAGTNLSPYMNPYTQAVIDPSMKLLEQQRRQGIGQIGDQATQARAFGGSRQGVAEGVTNAQSVLQAGQLGANLWGQNFNQAQAAATGDISRNFAAQQFNSQQGLSGAQFRGQMASQLAGLASNKQQSFLAGIQPAMAGQQIQTTQDQANLDAARQYYEEQRQYPLQQLQIKQNALAQSPYGKSSSVTGPGPSTDPLLTGLGTAATTAGLIGSLGRGNWLSGSNSGYTTNDQMRATDAEIGLWSRY